mgnify:CR=1 FL=1
MLGALIADIGAGSGYFTRRLATAALVLAYSRRLYFQFYPRFTRFECKVFLDEGVAYHDGACQRCMIDNTHVVVLHGTGRAMVPGRASRPIGT